MDEHGQAVTVVTAKPTEPIQLTEQAISTIQQNIHMSERLVMEVLEKDIDFGIHPGTNSMALRDPGASKINNAFNTYPDYKVLYQEEADTLITFHIQANLIDRKTGLVVAVGVGACSTMESKYGYRWVERPEDYGYDRKDLRRRQSKYRIPNPEVADLTNTILKMATKRAEIDACQNLPGVGSALRKLFGNPERKEPDWAAFWGRVAQLGISEEQVHKMLGVTSINQWIARGKTLDQAIKTISDKLAQLPKPEVTKSQVDQDSQEINPPDVPDLHHLEVAAYNRWHIQPAEMYNQLGCKNKSDCTQSPWECFLALKVIYEEV